MIESLRIQGLAIVERAELEFGPGLNVITGETGAGKSVVLGALSLLAGARAAPGALREGADEAVVEGLFRTDASPELEALLAQRGLRCDEHELVIHRTLSKAGRSRARIGGELVPVATLAELLEGRLEISSQHDSQSLLRPEVHGRLLDRFGDALALREQVESGVRRLKELEAERRALAAAAQERAQRQDYLAYGVREIDACRLDAAEIAALRAQRKRLAHVERLREEGNLALTRLSGDPSAPEAGAAADLVAEAARALAALGALDELAGGLAARLDATGAELRDVASELERWVDALEADPAQLAAADERLHAVERLERKYGGSVEAVLQQRAALAAELESSAGADTRLGEMERLRVKLESELEDAARALSAKRARAGERLAAEVETALHALAMPQASFAVALPRAVAPDGLPCGLSGFEAPLFVFSANRGEPLRALREIASGGELSRTFLALKQALREEEGGMVLVFDEVDAALGGEAANQVGRQLALLGASHQVLCITHLPQIAACADTHFRVAKHQRGGRTTVRIDRLGAEERVDEIARMAGGRAPGDAARAYARELLKARVSP